MPDFANDSAVMIGESRDDEWEEMEPELQSMHLEREINNFKDTKRRTPRSKARKDLRTNSALVSSRLDQCVRFIKRAGFRSVGDFLTSLHLDTSKSNINRCGRFFKQGGLESILPLWFNDLRVKGCYRHQCAIIKALDIALQKELRKIERTKEVRKKSKDFDSDTEYDVAKIFDVYQRYCPLLVTLLESLVRPQIVDDDDDIGPEDEGGVEPPRKRLNVVRSEKNRRLMVTTAMSTLLYARSSRNNLFQAVMGQYLHAHNTHREVIETVQALGLSTGYHAIIYAEKYRAQAQLLAVRKRVKTEPFMISWDNINRLVTVSHELLHNKKHMINWTTVAIIFLKDAGDSGTPLPIGSTLPSAWVNEGDRSGLTGIDFMISEKARKYHEPMCKRIIGEVIQKYMGEAANTKRVVVVPEEEGGDGSLRQEKECEWFLPEMDPIHAMDPTMTDAFTLKTLELNEGTIEGTGLVMDAIMKELDLQGDDLDGKIPCSGDQLSTSFLRVVRFLRNEEGPGRNLDWAVPVIGLFHLRMSILHLIMKYHLGNEDGRDPSSLYKFKNMLKRTGIGEKISNFRAAEELVEHVFVGHILGMFMEMLGANTIDDLAKRFGVVDVEAEIDRAYDQYFRVGLVYGMRKTSGYMDLPKPKKKKRSAEGGGGMDLDEEVDAGAGAPNDCDLRSDVVAENAILFLQHVALYMDLKNAIHVGDTGRIQLVLEYFTVMNQASNLHNYSIELLELSAAFRKEWTPEMREVYLRHCLVNLSGRAGAFMEVDRFQEHVVRTVSDRWNPNGNFSSSRYLREVISMNAMETKKIKEGFRRSATGKDNRRSRKTAKERGDVVIIAREVQSERVFAFKEGRCQGGGRLYQRVTDLLAEGTVTLLGGASLQRWKDRSEVRMGRGYATVGEREQRGDVGGDPDGSGSETEGDDRFPGRPFYLDEEDEDLDFEFL